MKYHVLYILGNSKNKDAAFIEDVPWRLEGKEEPIKVRLRKNTHILTSLLGNTTCLVFHKDIKQIIESLCTTEEVQFFQLEVWDYKEEEIISKDYYALKIAPYDALDHELSGVEYHESGGVWRIGRFVFDENKLKNIPHLFNHHRGAFGGDTWFSDILLSKLKEANASNILVTKSIDVRPPTNEEKDSADKMKVIATSQEFFKSIKENNFKLAKKLLDEGADIEYEDKLYGTALIHAVAEMHVKGIKFLLEQGANTNPKLADDEAFKDIKPSILLEVGYKLRPDCYDRVNTTYVGKGDDKCVQPIGEHVFIQLLKLFIQYGADVHGLSFRKQTPLMGAVRMGSIEATQILIDAGADASVKDEDGKDALAHAYDLERQNIIDLLKSNGISVDAKESQKRKQAVEDKYQKQTAEAPARAMPYAETLEELESMFVDIVINTLKTDKSLILVENLSLVLNDYNWS